MEQMYIKPHNPANWTCKDVLYALEQYTTNKSILTAFKVHNIDGGKLLDTDTRQWIASIGITGPSIEVVSKIVQSIKADEQRDTLIVQKLLDGSAAMSGSRHSLISTALSGSWWDNSSDGDFSEAFPAAEDDEEDVIIVSQRQTSNDTAFICISSDDSDSDHDGDRLDDMATSESSSATTPPMKKGSATETAEETLSQMMADTDIAATLANKQRRRVVPTLVSEEIPSALTGNLVDSDMAVRRLWPEPVPLLDRHEACAQLKSALASGSRLGSLSVPSRIQRSLESNKTICPMPPLPYLCEPGDSYWFYRPSRCRRMDAKSKPPLSQMEGFQQVYKQLLLKDNDATDSSSDVGIDGEDSVLPVYGDSGDEGAYSDHLIAEIDKEQQKIQKSEEAAKTAEIQRVELVEQIMGKRLQVFADEWQEKEMPKLDRKQLYLWRRHIANRSTLVRKLGDLTSRRLPKAKQSIVESGVSKEAHIARLCEGLRVTADEISRAKYLLQLLSRPRPLPPKHAPVYSDDSSASDKPHGRQPRRRRIVNSDGDDSMADFIDDEDDVFPKRGGKRKVLAEVELPPTPDSDPKQDNASSSGMAMDALDSAVASDDQQEQQTKHKRQDPCKMEVSDLFKAINRYTANDMFDAAMFYIRRMAQGKAAMSRLQQQTSNVPSVDINLALRVWAEYKQWLNAKPESVLVDYFRSRIRDNVVEQLKDLVKVLTDQDKWSNGTTQKPSRRLACQQLSGLANSSVGCLMHLPGPVKRANPTETDVRNTIFAPPGKSLLTIGSHILPEALRVLHDSGVAQRAAFAHFYSWRLQYTGYSGVIEVDSDVTGETLSEDVEEESSTDALCDGGSADPTDQQQVVPSKRSIDSDTEDVSNADSPVISPVAKSQKTGKRISSGGRRNIRTIRKENTEVLNMRRQQQMVEEEIERRRKEKAQSQSTSVQGEDESMEEVMASGTMQRTAVLRDSESIDPSKIGRPELVNPGHLEYQEDVKIPGFIASHLKSHQIAGIQFMWKNIVMTSNHYDHKSDDGESKNSSRKQLENASQHGCVLAHSMGLGKTLQTIALIYTIFNEVQNGNPEFIGSIFASRRALILCPPTVQANWAAEFVKWTGVDVSYSNRHRSSSSFFPGSPNTGPLLPPPFNISEDLDSGQKRKIRHVASAVKIEAEKVIVQVINYALLKTMDVRLRAIGSWHRNGGVLIIGYSSFRELMSYITSKKSPHSDDANHEQQYAIIEDLRRYLLENGPGLVIADEGHNIKNHKTQLSSYANMLRSKARICLTGYPLQNHLDEYWTMVNFCFPGYLGDLKDFSNMYINPIKNGLYMDSTVIDKRTSTIRMKALQSLLSALVERRDSSVLYHQLPRKVEYIISCPLTELQMKLYMSFLAYFLGIGSDKDSAMLTTASKAGLLKFGTQLLTICNHPAVCQKVFEARQQIAAAAAAAAACSRETTVVPREEDLDLEPSIIDEEGLMEANTENQTPAIEDGRWCQDIFTEQASDLRDACHSTKAQIVLRIIKHSILQGERVLVFSRSIPTLDYLQQMVESSGVLPKRPESMRIDGSTQMNIRQALIDKFNSGNSSHYVFFISSGTGSIGVNLVAANRVILYDIGWNPLYDEQAVARAYRYGQKRRVYVYRLITTGTWEDRLFNNNVFKVSLTRRVVDKQSMGRRISKEDLGKYFVPPPAKIKQITDENVNELKSLYQDDVVFIELLNEFASHISKVTPQATLLANEDDVMQDIDETELLKLVESEKIRLGLIKAPTPPPQPTTMPPNQQKPANVNPVLPPFQLDSFPVQVSLAVLALLQRRLTNINHTHIENENQMRLLTTMRDLVQNWINWLLSYVDTSTPGFEKRNKELIRVIKDRVPQNTLFVRLVPQLHAMNDMQLLAFIRENAPKSN